MLNLQFKFYCTTVIQIKLIFVNIIKAWYGSHQGKGIALNQRPYLLIISEMTFYRILLELVVLEQGYFSS